MSIRWGFFVINDGYLWIWWTTNVVNA
jgi:hypothetical protein